MKRLWHFFTFVWRPVHGDESGVYRMSAATAWDLAGRML